jgi:menaquinone-dependent protoporphyrinogen oxidase
MKILILYGTTEGQTRKIAQFAAETLRAHGDEITLVDAADARGKIEPSLFDGAILAASIHAQKYQPQVVAFARAHQIALSAMPATFISVSLSAAGTDPEDLEGIAKCASGFLAETGWQKAEIHHVAGAFRFSEYDFFKNWMMRLIARSKKVKPKAGEDLELTDWAELGHIVEAFRARLAPSSASKTG